MAYLLSVCDDSGNCLATLRSRTSRYLWEDGVQVAMDEQIAWCAVCREFVLAEELVTAEAEKQRLADSFWKKHGDERTAFLLDALQRLQRDAIAERMRWFDYLMLHRVSPPRCLKCGSTEVEPYGSREWAEHPAGSGRVQFRCIAHLDTVVCNLYSPEGAAIVEKLRHSERHASE